MATTLINIHRDAQRHCDQFFGPHLVRVPITIEAHRGRFRTNENEIRPLLVLAKPLT